MATKKCQVQLVLKKDERDGGLGVEFLRSMLRDLGKYPKFLFSTEQRWRLGYDPIGKFRAINWDLEKIDVEAPEYTVSTQSMTFNFIVEADTFPQGIVDILQANGFTVTGRHRMGVGLGYWKTEWEAWDYSLDEAGKRAAWTADVEKIDQDIAKIEREIRDCKAMLAIVSVLEPTPATGAEKQSLKIQTFADFRRRLFECVFAHQDLFGLPGPEGHSVHSLIDNLRRLQLSADTTIDIENALIYMSFFFCCQCAFEVQIAHDIFGIEDEDVLAFMPKDPFASEMRARMDVDEDFKAEWMKMLSTTWKCIQYTEKEPQYAEFMELYPSQETWNYINKFVGSHEARKTELQARRVEVLRNLAHLHGATVGRGGEAGLGKRKLAEMSALLACLQRMACK